jgi:DNA-binding NarL/FixJ family response regulator
VSQRNRDSIEDTLRRRWDTLPATVASKKWEIGIIREGGILALFAKGYKNAEIADHLVISPKTVRNYVSNIISKLQVADRAQAILRVKDAVFGITGSNS